MTRTRQSLIQAKPVRDPGAWFGRGTCWSAGSGGSERRGSELLAVSASDSSQFSSKAALAPWSTFTSSRACALYVYKRIMYVFKRLFLYNLQMCRRLDDQIHCPALRSRYIACNRVINWLFIMNVGVFFHYECGTGNA